MNRILMISLFGLASGMLGTGIGGLLGNFIQVKGKKKLSFVLEFTGGLMLAVVCFDLLPEAFAQSGIAIAVIGVLLGVCAVIFLQNLVYRIKPQQQENPMLQSGIFILIGMALHNFPEGLAIGSGFSISTAIGQSIFLVIALHDMVEGACISFPVRAGGKSAWFAVKAACISGIPTGVGALIGAMVGEISPVITALCLSFAAGAMLYIICGDILVQSKRLYHGRLPAIGYILGFVIGMVITLSLAGA